MKYTKFITKSSLIAASLSLTLMSIAQANTNSGRWYQVEMIVFKNNTIKSVHPEQFDISVLPSKPDTVETLSESKTQPISFLDFDFSLLSQPDLDLQTLINEERYSYDQIISFFGTKYSTENLLPKPYILLEPTLAEFSLLEHATNFENSNKVDVLDYFAWQQPIYDAEVYTPIELNFGNEFGGQYEISGWLHLTISRYIHVNPQLYINEFTQINQQEFADLSFGFNNGFKTDTNNQLFKKEQPYRITSSIEVNETQQTASKQILYIDHPELSFLFYFTPMEFTTD